MTLENVKRGIAQLEAINSHDEFAYEKALLAYKTIQDLPILVYQTPSDIRICRTRTHDTPKPYDNVREISLPTYDYVRHFARCNRPFQPKFYGGENRPTSFIELAEYWAETKNFGDKLYVTTGLWVTKKSLDAIIISTPDKSDRKSEYDNFFGKILDDYINQYDGEFKEAMTEFYRFLTQRFRKPAKHDLLTYIITTAYCNLALLHGKGNCVLYPSVPFGGEGINFAISSDFINAQNIELRHVICNELTIFENELGKHTFQETASISFKGISANYQLVRSKKH